MFKTSLASLGLGLTALLANPAPALAAGAEIHFNPSFESVAVGQVFNLVLQGSGFDFTPDGASIQALTGGQNISLSYSASLLEIQQIVIDPRWNLGSDDGTINAASGTVTGLRFGTFPSTPDDAFNIATFTVRALAPGQGTLQLVSGTYVGKVNNLSGQSLTPLTQPAVVAVVPEPSQWAILLLGLGMLGAVRRRRG